MNWKKKASKYSLFITLSIIFSTIVSSFILLNLNIPQEKLKKAIEYDLSKQFDGTLKIETFSGNFLTKIILSNVNITVPNEKKPIIKAKSITLKYSIIDLIRYAGYFPAALKTIEINTAEIHIHRLPNGTWILPKIKPSKKKKFPLSRPFVGTLNIKNATLVFKDEHGWYPEKIKTPYKETIQNCNGGLIFDRKNRVTIELKGGLKSNKSPLKISGFYNIETEKYALKAHVTAFNGEILGAYALNVPGFKILSAAPVGITAKIQRKAHEDGHLSPFWYQVDAHFSKSQLQLPFFKMPLENIQGPASLYKGRIDIPLIKEYLPEFSNKEAFELIKKLINIGLLDETGTRTDLPLTEAALELNKKEKKHKKIIESLLKNPPLRISFNQIKASLNGIDGTVEGDIKIEKQALTLKIQSPKFETQKIKGLLPETETWSYEGAATGVLTITGPFHETLISGNIKSTALNVYGIEPEQADISFSYLNHLLKFKSESITLAKGNLNLVGEVDLNESGFINVTLTEENLDAATFLKSQESDISGKVSFIIKAEGPLKNFNTTVAISGNGLTVFNQKIAQIAAVLPIVNFQYMPFRGTLIFNKTPLDFKGEMKDANTLSIQSKLDKTPFFDPYPESKETLPGKATLETTLITYFDKPAPKSILQRMHINAKGSIENASYFEETWDKVHLDLSLNQGNVFISYLEAEKNQEKIHIDGSFTETRPKNINITLQKVNIATNKWIQKIAPDFLKDTEGTLFGTFHLNQKTDASEFKIANYKINATLEVQDAKLDNQPIENVQTTLLWDNNTLTLPKIEIRHKASKINASYTETPLPTLEIFPGTTLALNNFKSYTSPYGDFDGNIQIEGKIIHPEENPEIIVSLNAQNIQYNRITLNNINGKIQYKNTELSSEKLTIQLNNSSYVLNGYWKKNIQQSTSPYSYKARLNMVKGRIEDLFVLYQTLTNDLQKTAPSLPLLEKIPNGNIQMASNFSLYHPITGNTILYNATTKISKLDTFYETPGLSTTPSKNERTTVPVISGELEGSIEIQSKPESIIPNIRTTLKLENSTIGALKSKKGSLTITSSTENSLIKLELSKGYLQDTPFEDIAIEGNLNANNILTITKTKIQTNKINTQQFLMAKIPLNAIGNPQNKDPLSIEFNLKGNNIGILTLLNPNITKITNEGALRLKIEGTLYDPIITEGSLDLQNFKIESTQKRLLIRGFKYGAQTQTQEAVSIKKSMIKIKNNQANIPNSIVNWTNYGYKLVKTEHLNQFSVEGSLSIIPHLFENIAIEIALILKPTVIKIDTKHYKGEILTETLSLKGLLTLPLSEKAMEEQQKKIKSNTEKGPILEGKIKFENGTFFGSSESLEPTLYPPIGLNLDILFGKDVFINASFLGTGPLSGITSELEVENTSSFLKLKGTLNTPLLENKLIFKEGAFTLLNKEFELLPEAKQGSYFKITGKTPHTNGIDFELIETAEGIKKSTPYINITAISIIQNPNVSPNIETKTDTFSYTHAVSSIEGSLSQIKVSDFDFYGSSSDRIPNTTLRFIKSLKLNLKDATKSEEKEGVSTEIIQTLFPEFFVNTIETNSIANQVGGQRINQVVRREVFRPIEKQVAKNIGLYDVRINYDLGKALLENNNTTYSKVDVNMMQRIISDQLFLRIKTDLDFNSQSNQTSDPISISEIELSYFLLKKRNLSLNYANVKDTIIRSEYKPKLSLKYNYDF